jgi:hypothetical protein
MPITEVILIPYREYTRLLKSENEHRNCTDHKDEAHKKHQVDHKGSGDQNSAVDLVGQGAAHHPTGYDPNLVVPNPNNAEVMKMMESAYGSDIPSNNYPPPPIPFMRFTMLPDNSGQIRLEAKRDKTLPPPPPYNPLAEDPEEGTRHKVQQGSGSASASARPYYLGPIDDFSSEEEDDY